MNKKKLAVTLIIVIFLIIAIPVLCQVFILNQNGNSLLPNDKRLHEADYVHAYCNGVEEYVLPDKTRIDCLTDTYACEFDWAKKWYEGFGQALWYAHNTGKKPCLVLILKSDKDYKYFNRAKILSDKYNVNLIEVKSKEYINELTKK